MNLTDKHIQDFIEAWQKDFGETLSPEVARAEANRLLDFFFQMEEELRSRSTRAKDAMVSEKDKALRDAWRKTMRRGI